MPSAEAKPDQGGSQDLADHSFGKALAFVKFKIRNLEMRKKKTEQLKKKVDDGLEHELEREQVLAVGKLPEIVFALGYLEQVFGRLQQCGAEVSRLDKQRRQQARQERLASDHSRLQRVLAIQDVLNSIDESVRASLLNSASAADSDHADTPPITEQNLQHLDDLFRLITPSRDNSDVPFQEQLSSSAEHLLRLVDYSHKKAPVTSPTVTYDSLARLIDRLAASGVLDQHHHAGHEKQQDEEQLEQDEAADGGQDETGLIETGDVNEGTAAPLMQQQADVVHEENSPCPPSSVVVVENGTHASVPPAPPSSMPTSSANTGFHCATTMNQTDTQREAPCLASSQQRTVTGIQFLQDSELSPSNPSLVDPAVVSFAPASSSSHQAAPVVGVAAPGYTSFTAGPTVEPDVGADTVAAGVIVSQTFTNSNFQPPPAQQPPPPPPPASSTTTAPAPLVSGGSWADEPEMPEWGSAGWHETARPAATSQQAEQQQQQQLHEQQHVVASGGEWTNSTRYHDSGRAGGRYRGNERSMMSRGGARAPHNGYNNTAPAGPGYRSARPPRGNGAGGGGGMVSRRGGGRRGGGGYRGAAAGPRQ